MWVRVRDRDRVSGRCGFQCDLGLAHFVCHTAIDLGQLQVVGYKRSTLAVEREPGMVLNVTIREREHRDEML